MRTVHAGPLAGLIGQMLLLLALAMAVGIGELGWAVGAGCGVVAHVAVARGLVRSGADRLGPAMWVTIARVVLAGGVAALVAASFYRQTPVAILVALAAVALALDVIDGQVARRTGTASAFGARFDGEVDALLILVLSVYVARSAGVWVLAIGAARYAFLLAGWRLPWLRAALPPRYWRKVAAATQGIVLTVAAADVLPGGIARVALAGALAVLAESFGRDVLWLWSNRGAAPADAGAERDIAPAAGGPPAGRPRGRVRRVLGVVLTVVSLVIVWAGLVAPSEPELLTLRAFARVPLEGLVLLAIVLVLPVVGRRILAFAVGPLLGVLVIVKILDIGFLTSFDRRFDPASDWTYTQIGLETLREAIGRRAADVVAAGVVVLLVALLLLTALGVLRLARVAAGNRRWSMRAVAVLGVLWALAFAFGVEAVPGVPVASTSAAAIAVDEVRAVRAGQEGQAIFIEDVKRDRFRDAPAEKLLTGLRGKDVLFVVVESYGRVAVQDSAIAPQVGATLDDGTRRLAAAGFAARTGFLTSSTFGGISWLAHATFHSGTWVDSQRRYDHLVMSGRFTISKAFQRAGWRIVDLVPAHNRDWPEGEQLYGYDQVYDRRNLGYRGSPFGYGPMPDQFTLAALQRLELSRPGRGPLFAELDLVSSHTPWTDIPQLVPWDDLGDGSIFRHVGTSRAAQNAIWGDGDRVRAAYGRSIEYAMSSVVSFVERYGDDDLVLVVLGDHQPATVITGPDASHDVPISIIAHDPAVLDQIAAWGFGDGLRPDPQAPVWPMNAFRDRFLTAFGSEPASP